MMKKLFLIGVLVSAILWSGLSYSAKKEWTFMVYLDGDNDLEYAAIDDFLEMASVGSDEKINIVVQMDRAPKYDTSYGNWTKCHRFLITKGMKPYVYVAISDWGDGRGGREVNMGDPGVLTDFINWATKNYSAKKYALILWNHGDGWREKIKELQRKGVRIDGVNRAVCWDFTSNYDCLYMSEVKQALEKTNIVFDLIGFDACFMGMIEVAYQIKNFGTVMVGSQEKEPGDGWPYHTILADLKKTPIMSAASLGKVIVDRYGEEYEGRRYITQSAIDLKKLPTLATKTSAFADTLEYYWDEIRTARKMTNSVWSYADLYDFVDLVEEINDIDIKSNAEELKSELSEAIIANYASENFKGLSIYFPKSSQDQQYEDYVTLKPVDFPNDTTWDEFLIRFCKTELGIPRINPLYTVATNTSFVVRWSEVPDVSYYELQETETKTIYAWQMLATTTERSYTIQGKLKEGFYYYRVRAIGGENIGNWSIPEDIWVGENMAPTISILTPPSQGTTADNSFEISFYALDPDDVAKISLYYDTDDKGYDGKLITKDIYEEDGTKTYHWKTSYMPYGTYYIYAIISDGKEKERKAQPVYSKYSGPLTITHGTKSWTFMVYLDGDNDLEQFTLADLEIMKKVGSSDNVNIVVQLDGIWNHPEAKRYYILKDEAKVVDQIGEVNMADEETVISFINWSIFNYPAEKYAFVFMNHGGGWRTKEELKPYLDKIKHVNKAVCWDSTSAYDCLYMSEVKEALSKTNAKINLIGFDACLMGMLEVAYQIKDYADVMVASQEVEFAPGWPYESILKDLITTPTMTPKELGVCIVNRFDEYEYRWDEITTQSAIDLSKISLVASATSALANDIISHWDKIKYKIKKAREKTESTRWVRNYVDLYHFASLIRNSTVTEAVKEAVIENYAGIEHLNFHGLSIYFPKTKVEWKYEYIEYVEDQVIDFPKDTEWDEFLKLYTEEFSKGYFTGSYTEKTTDEDKDEKYDYLLIDAELFIRDKGYYYIRAELSKNGTIMSRFYERRYFSFGTNTLSVEFLGPDIFSWGFDDPYSFKITVEDADIFRGTTSVAYNYTDFEEIPYGAISGTISYPGRKKGNLWYGVIPPDRIISPDEIEKFKKGEQKYYWVIVPFEGPGTITYHLHPRAGTWCVFSFLDVKENERRDWLDVGDPVGLYGSLSGVYLRGKVYPRWEDIKIIGAPNFIKVLMGSSVSGIDFALTHEVECEGISIKAERQATKKGDSLTLTCLSSITKGPVDVAWTLIGDIGIIRPIYSTDVAFYATKIGTGTIIAYDGFSMATIDIVVGEKITSTSIHSITASWGSSTVTFINPLDDLDLYLLLGTTTKLGNLPNNIGVGIDIKVYGTQAQSVNTITASVMINYNQATLLDDIDLMTLRLYVSHDDGDTWEEVKEQYHDQKKRRIYGTLTNLSLVAIAGKPKFAQHLRDAFVYPNPYIPSKGHKDIHFTNLTADAVIRIYDISGTLIKELRAGEKWNPKADGITSGVYIYIIKDHKEYKTGRLAIIR